MARRGRGRHRGGRRRGGAGAALGTALLSLLVLALVAAAAVAVVQPRLVVGPPLPQVATGRTLPKPDPPKLRAAPAPGKAGAIDLVDVPAAITVAPPGDPLVQAVGEALQQAFARAGDVGTTAVTIIDGQGRVVFDVGGDRPLLPASTAKLVTAAAALAAFGPDHTFSTTVTTDAPVTADGVVAGDLLLLGGGDPSLVSEAWVAAALDPDRPHTSVGVLADQLVAEGITAVEGSVVGDDGFLLGAPLAEGWPPRYLEDGDATPITGLTIDRGRELFQTDAGSLRSRPSVDPALDAARALTTALVTRGIRVDGAPASVAGTADPSTRLGLEQGVLPVLGEVVSPPLVTLLTTMVQRSDNHIADTLFRAVGRRVEGEGSFGDGGTQGLRVLQELELDWSGTVMADGSGLSRSSRLPAGVLTALNFRMTNSAVGTAWQDLMAVSGSSGTLRRRLTDTIAELRLRGKTGSLGDVRSLSGVIVGPDGTPLYLTILSNDLDGPSVAAARRLQDLMVLALTAELYGCTELPPVAATPGTAPAETPPGTPAQEAVPDAAAAEVDPPVPPADGVPPLPEYTCG